VIPIELDYVAPETVSAARQELRAQKGATVLAGGHALVPAMTAGKTAPTRLVDLRRIAELHGITVGARTRIGPMTTLAEIADSAQIRANLPALADAVMALRDPLVRNRATLGGNLIARWAPTDLPAAILALEASLIAAGNDGERRIPAERFYLDDGSVALAADELLVGVEIPTARGSAYQKMREPAGGRPLCGIAVRVELAANGAVGRCRMAVTGACAAPMRLPRVEAALEGRAVDGGAGSGWLSAELFKGIPFMDDWAASAVYRAQLARVLAERALVTAAQRIAAGNVATKGEKG
jgi:aerobic carbon-monoxide dehydrogenase medium subunit